jgi:hypothetical protein
MLNRIFAIIYYKIYAGYNLKCKLGEYLTSVNDGSIYEKKDEILLRL